MLRTYIHHILSGLQKNSVSCNCCIQSRKLLLPIDRELLYHLLGISIIHVSNDNYYEIKLMFGNAFLKFNINTVSINCVYLATRPHFVVTVSS